MSLEYKNIKRSVTRKGFKKIPNRNNHAFYSFNYNDEPTRVRIHFSHGSKKKTADDGMVSLMAEECLMCKRCFEKFVSCNISEQDYIKHLKGLERHFKKVILPSSSDHDSSITDGRTELCQKCVSKAKSSRQWI